MTSAASSFQVRGDAFHALQFSRIALLTNASWFCPVEIVATNSIDKVIEDLLHAGRQQNTVQPGTGSQAPHTVCPQTPTESIVPQVTVPCDRRPPEVEEGRAPREMDDDDEDDEKRLIMSDVDINPRASPGANAAPS